MFTAKMLIQENILFGIIALLVLSSQIGVTNTSTINDTETLHENLFQNYYKNVRPVYDQEDAITVDVTLYIKSIQEFDEVNEKFSFVAALQLHWLDYKLKWNPDLYGGLTLITVSYDDIWVPDLTLSSPSARVATLGKSTDRMRIDFSGEAEWMPANLFESTCSISVRNYPFDVQSCEIIFMSLGYKSYEVSIEASQSTIAFDVYSSNALWDVIGSSVSTRVVGTGLESEIIFTLKLRRKSSFAVINIIIPSLVLSLLNVLVFLLVPESGERIGYCITTLLAVAVYMTIVSDMLPKTSKPVPLISYKLMLDMIISAMIVFVTVLNMRLHSKSEDCIVPDWLQFFHRLLTCAHTKVHPTGEAERNPKKINVSPLDKTNAFEEEKCEYKVDNKTNILSTDSLLENPITWKSISYMIDWLALMFFTSVSLINMIVYIVMARS